MITFQNKSNSSQMEFFHRNPQGISALFHRVREHRDSSLSRLNTIGCVTHVAQISAGLGHSLLDDTSRWRWHICYLITPTPSIRRSEPCFLWKACWAEVEFSPPCAFAQVNESEQHSSLSNQGGESLPLLENSEASCIGVVRDSYCC